MQENKMNMPMHFRNAPVPIPNLDTHFVALAKRHKLFYAGEGVYVVEVTNAAVFSEGEAPKADGTEYQLLSLRDALALPRAEVPQSGSAMLRTALERVLSASEKGYIKGLYGPLLGYIWRALEQPDPVATPVSVPVAYWDSTRYNPDGGIVPTATFQIDIEDQRESDGHVYVTVGTVEGDVDDMLSCAVEVARLPGGAVDLPCVRLNFDGHAHAAAFFKVGEEIIVRPESGVTIRNTMLPNGEIGWVLK